MDKNLAPSRRQALVGGALTVGLWAAPSILTIDTVAAGSVDPNPPPVPTSLHFEKLGCVPRAVAQSTAWGKSLQGLIWHDGRLWGGYGDWNANTGPIYPWSWSPSEGIRDSGFASQNECIALFRSIQGKLFFPYTDPKPSDGFVGKLSGSTWTAHQLTDVYHVFDIAEHKPTGHIIVVGGGSPETPERAMNWRSTDGGQTFTETFGYGNPTRIANGGRSYYITQTPDGNLVMGSAPNRQWIYNGVAPWVQVPDRTYPITNQWSRVDYIGGRYVQHYFTTSCSMTTLVINGDPSRSANCSTVTPDGAVWYFAGARLKRFTVSNVETEITHDFAGCPMSMAVGPDGNVYVGDTTGCLWRGTYSR